MLVAKTGHLEGVRNTATGFLGKPLDIGIGVIVSHKHRILLLQSRFYTSLQLGLFLRAERLRLGSMRQVLLNKDTVFSVSHYCVSVLREPGHYNIHAPGLMFLKQCDHTLVIALPVPCLPR